MAQSIIIVGAGAAGLMAAKLLSEAGNKVILLETDSRAGGRMHTINGEGFNQPVEAGAEFIHGDVPITLGLLKQAGIEHTRTGGKMYRSNNGRWQEEEDMVDDWDELTEKMNQLQEDITLQQFLKKYFSDEKYAGLRTQVNNFAEGFDVADPAKVSLFMLRDEWEHEGPNYRIKGGYINLVDHMLNDCVAHGCVVHLNSPVTRINWQPDEVEVQTKDNVYTAQKVLITVPIVMLQNNNAANAIQFTPALDDYITAANDIGYGDVIKVVLQFSEPFWNHHKSNVGFIVSNEWMPVWWTQYPAEATTLTGWMGGPKATAVKGLPDQEMLQKCVRSLASIFNIAEDEIRQMLTAHKVFNWAGNNFAHGAYSYATPLTKKALTILQTPVNNKLYFAGEAIYSGEHPGTVEAAFASGQQAAKLIME